MFSFFNKKDRTQEIEVKVNQILTSIVNDRVNDFNDAEQAKIILTVLDRFKQRKHEKLTKALELSKELENIISKLNAKQD